MLTGYDAADVTEGEGGGSSIKAHISVDWPWSLAEQLGHSSAAISFAAPLHCWFTTLSEALELVAVRKDEPRAPVPATLNCGAMDGPRARQYWGKGHDCCALPITHLSKGTAALGLTRARSGSARLCKGSSRRRGSCGV